MKIPQIFVLILVFLIHYISLNRVRFRSLFCEWAQFSFVILWSHDISVFATVEIAICSSSVSIIVVPV